MNNLPGNFSSNPFAPPSYDNVLGMDREAQFDQFMASAIPQAQAIVSDGDRLHGFNPTAIAKGLAEYFINHYSLSLPQVGSISTGPKNPTVPDMDAWKAWEDKHCLYRGDTCSFKSEKVKKNIYWVFEKHLTTEVLKGCRSVLTAMKFYPSAVDSCTNAFNLTNLFYHGLKPMTPFITNCIQAGVFTEEFINDLLKVTK
ncbi:hypothetical protein [Endozoicomonas sp. ONNA2]|uniref:hypothetical protein n=1 Tax=Endozoicomonas sp. ONNA2 TaxID=2828741 RepID=UPI002147236A|nr:hypothetical protein [Endozoicomonas sp. ONNA2]